MENNNNNNVPLSEFSKRLKMLRYENNVSITELAQKIGITKSTISRYENAKMEPTLPVLREIVKHFGVTLDWLCGVSDINNRYSDKSKYDDVVNKCMVNNISPEKIEQLISLIKE